MNQINQMNQTDLARPHVQTIEVLAWHNSFPQYT